MEVGLQLKGRGGRGGGRYKLRGVGGRAGRGQEARWEDFQEGGKALSKVCMPQKPV